MIEWWRNFSKRSPRIVLLLFIAGCATAPEGNFPGVSTDPNPPELEIPKVFPVVPAPQPPEAGTSEAFPVFVEPEPPPYPPLEVPIVYERILVSEIPRPQGIPAPADLPPIPAGAVVLEPPSPASPVLPARQPPVTLGKPQAPVGEASVEAAPAAHSWRLIESREDRQFFVSPRDTRLVVLEGLGWTFQGGSAEYRLVKRYAEGGNTYFAFLFSHVGGGELLFQRQEIPRQILHKRKVSLSVSEPPPQNLGPVGGTPPSETVGDLEPTEDDGSDWSFFAGALGSGNFTALHDLRWRNFLAAGGGETEILLETADLLWRKGEWEILEPLVKVLQRRNLPPWREDGLLILLGRFYDGGSPWRDEKIALKYYRRLAENFPSSLYWDEADKRARYLRRYYFQIR